MKVGYMVQSVEEKRKKNAEYMYKYRAERKNDPLFIERQRENMRNFRNKNPGYQSLWAENHPEYRIRNTQKYRERHPEKIRAQKQAQRYVVLGNVCFDCGVKGELERHHPNYKNPLEVITLCHTCHMKIHNPQK